MMKKQEIILSMQTAFLGAICNKVRLIAFDMTEELFTLYEKICIIENNDNILLLNTYKGCFFMRFENNFD